MTSGRADDVRTTSG